MSETELYERFMEDLSPEEIEKLRQIKTIKDIKTVEVIDEWTDDHIKCVGVKVNEVEFGLWWIGPNAGAFYYPDSPKAKREILSTIKDRLDDMGEDNLNNKDEDSEQEGQP